MVLLVLYISVINQLTLGIGLLISRLHFMVLVNRSVDAADYQGLVPLVL